MDHVKFSQVKKSFSTDFWKASHVAVSNLSFVIETQKTTALVGHNGAGKTTLIKMLLGLISLDQGEILFGDHPVDDRFRSLVGYMPEVHKLPQKTTPYELLQLLSQKTDHLSEIIDLCGLGPYQNKPLYGLSKGTKQRVSWAQALVRKPNFYILDEPLSGLDPFWQKQMTDWIQSEQTLGKTFLICSHELHFLEHFCHRILVLKQGCLCFEGDFSDFITKKHVLEYFHV